MGPLCMGVYFPWKPWSGTSWMHNHTPLSQASVSSMLSQTGREDSRDAQLAYFRIKAAAEAVLGRLIIANKVL